jgi:hypothetical protein
MLSTLSTAHEYEVLLVVYWILYSLICLPIDGISNFFLSDSEKGLEILALCHQLRIIQRKTPSPLQLYRPEKLILTGTPCLPGHLTQSFGPSASIIRTPYRAPVAFPSL